MAAALLCLVAPRSIVAQESQADPAVYIYRPEPVPVAEVGVPIHPAVAPSPDGRFFAVLQTRPDPVLWIVPADGGEPFGFRKMWAAYNPRWAPSGDRIGFIAGIGPPRIWTVEVDPTTGRPTDPPRLLYRTDANAYAFAPDGARVAFVPRRTTARGASEIHIVEWQSRKVRILLRENGMIYRLDWAPDGDHIYYGIAPGASADSAHRVVRARLQGASRETVLRVREFLGLSPDGLALLYRPDDLEAIRNNALEIATAGGEPLFRIAVAGGTTPTWGASSASLVQVRGGAAGDEITVIPLPGLWRVLIW